MCRSHFDVHTYLRQLTFATIVHVTSALVSTVILGTILKTAPHKVSGPAQVSVFRAYPLFEDTGKIIARYLGRPRVDSDCATGRAASPLLCWGHNVQRCDRAQGAGMRQRLAAHSLRLRVKFPGRGRGDVSWAMRRFKKYIYLFTHIYIFFSLISLHT